MEGHKKTDESIDSLRTLWDFAYNKLTPQEHSQIMDLTLQPDNTIENLEKSIEEIRNYLTSNFDSLTTSQRDFLLMSMRLKRFMLDNTN